MFYSTSVLPAPPQPHATLIQNLSMVLIITGITAVLFLLPPVRNAIRELLDRVTDFFYGSSDIVTETTDEVFEEEPTTTATSRREIENFDLDLFA
jgi:UPF0716 family protein affecting phage T7 exclusion